MILDSFKLSNLIVQLEYPSAFELWDEAGSIARRISGIWQGLEHTSGQPDQQTLAGPNVNIQTGFNVSTISLSGGKGFDRGRVQQIKETFDVWRQSLLLGDIKRISTRATYTRDFLSIKEANAALFALKLVRIPAVKVFDQPMDSDRNSVEVLYRFQDEQSFSVLRLKAEEVKYEVTLSSEFFDESEIRETKYRMIIDLDRGVLGSVNAEKFRIDDWLKGFQHVLHRDLDKVIKGEE
ncbi:MAG: hypothetical protein ABIG70_02875 [Pseudomonadota bacterium]